MVNPVTEAAKHEFTDNHGNCGNRDKLRRNVLLKSEPNSEENKKKLFQAMKDAMKDDRAKNTILPLTKFGLMQITRQRVRPEMNIATKESNVQLVLVQAR